MTSQFPICGIFFTANFNVIAVVLVFMLKPCLVIFYFLF